MAKRKRRSEVPSGVHLLGLAIGGSFRSELHCSTPKFPITGHFSQQKRESPRNQEDDDNRCYLSDKLYSRFFFFTTRGLRWSACMGKCGQ